MEDHEQRDFRPELALIIAQSLAVAVVKQAPGVQSDFEQELVMAAAALGVQGRLDDAKVISDYVRHFRERLEAAQTGSRPRPN